jgi:hypothetical protein
MVICRVCGVARILNCFRCPPNLGRVEFVRWDVVEGDPMDAALVALAAAGGTTLVQAVATDAWALVRGGFSSVLSRGDRTRVATVEQQLDRTRSEVEATTASPEADRVRDAHRAAWAARLEDLLVERPELAGALQKVLDDVAAAGGSVGRVEQRVAGFDQAQQAVQGHGAQVVTFGSVTPAKRPGA